MEPMARSRRPWLVGLALAAPLVLLTAWLIGGALRPGPADHGAGDAHASDALPPAAEFPAERLEERVDGAADALRAAGCERIRYWRLDAPPADAEALVFRSAEHARAALQSEAGPARTGGPGDEAQVSDQAVYFRRGAVLVRVFPDPGASAPSGLLRFAERLDAALRQSAHE
jgi:hypothetical protein